MLPERETLRPVAVLKQRLVDRDYQEIITFSFVSSESERALGVDPNPVRVLNPMASNLDVLFPGMQIEATSMFRVTRNAITERDEEEADDLLEMIEIEMRERKFAPVVRLQVDGELRVMGARERLQIVDHTRHPFGRREHGAHS